MKKAKKTTLENVVLMESIDDFKMGTTDYSQLLGSVFVIPFELMGQMKKNTQSKFDKQKAELLFMAKLRDEFITEHGLLDDFDLWMDKFY